MTRADTPNTTPPGPITVSLPQAVRIAFQHHEAGRIAEAEAIYRQVLGADPSQVDALHYLGVLNLQRGNYSVAIDLIGRAVTVRPQFAAALNNLAIALHYAGRLDEAEAACRQAIQVQPDFADPYCNLTNVLVAKGQFDRAITAGRRGLELNPQSAEAHFNLGVALLKKGDLENAIPMLRRATEIRPDYAEAFVNLGSALSDARRPDEAVAALRRAIQIKPDLPLAHLDLGSALRSKGDWAEAIKCFEQALSLDPNLAEAHSNLGSALTDAGKFDEAIAACQRAIALNPNLWAAHLGLGNAQWILGRLDEAISSANRAIQLKPREAQAHSNLANALMDAGRLDDAIASYRRAMDLNPRDASFNSNLIFSLHMHPQSDSGKILAECRQWAERYEKPLAKFIAPHPNDRSPTRPLRVGYVSADLREHPAGRCLLAMSQNHDPRNVHAFYYSSAILPDQVTDRFKALPHAYRAAAGWSDVELAQHIRADRIDILVDLSLHSARGRLITFAQKPAPVQAAWLAYPSTSGLSAMDYRLTDPFIDPPHQGDEFYSEKSIRLPHCFLCYQPPENAPEVNPLPASKAGYVTFGSFNSYAKVTEQALKTWAEIMRSLPGSRLLMICPPGAHREKILSIFQAAEISPNRLELIPRLPGSRYPYLYHRADICLDAFPYNGHVTTCDALWMGVPTVTLRGQTAVGRAGVSVLTNVDLPDWIAETPEQYVHIATEMAGNLPRLAELRSTLRERLRASPFMNHAQFAKDLESAYRRMWQNWCTPG